MKCTPAICHIFLCKEIHHHLMEASLYGSNLFLLWVFEATVIYALKPQRPIGPYEARGLLSPQSSQSTVVVWGDRQGPPSLLTTPRKRLTFQWLPPQPCFLSCLSLNYTWKGSLCIVDCAMAGEKSPRLQALCATRLDARFVFIWRSIYYFCSPYFFLLFLTFSRYNIMQCVIHHLSLLLLLPSNVSVTLLFMSFAMLNKEWI